MIRMHQFRSAKELKNYYTAALEGGDYYMEAEKYSPWHGKLAERMGLGEFVTKEEFSRLADNLHPKTGQQLTPRNKSDRTAGYDINFHVPKSVSATFLESKDERILDAIRESVRETMRELEQQTRTRVRLEGKTEDERVTGELAWGEFLHTTTRPEDGVPDPHLHVHCVVFNATWDPVERRYKAAQFRDIKRDMPYHEAAFYSRLAWRLETLGYRIERNGEKGWEIAGIPESVRHKYSRRTTAIETLAKRLGITNPARKAALGALSRAKKSKNVKPEKLRDEWLSWLTPDERRAVESVIKNRSPARGREAREQEFAREGLEFAIAHRFYRQSVVPQPRLLESALRWGLGKFLPESLRDAAGKHSDLLRREEKSETLVTTRQVLAEERAMLAFARDGRGTCVPLEGREPWTRGYANLSKQQQGAIEHLMQSRDRVMLVRGGAGTGKSRLVPELQKALTARGNTLTVLAPLARASRGQRDKQGFERADTLATFLGNREQQDRAKGGVLFVDEAGVIGTQEMRDLFKVAERIKARVILCGDTRQHPPVGRGDALRLLETRIGLQSAELSEIMRQQGSYKRAVDAFQKGEYEEGVRILDRMGAIREVKEGDWSSFALDYLETIKTGRMPYAISPTHARGDELTRLMRAALKRDGKLSQDERLVKQLKPVDLSDAERSDANRYEPGQVVRFHQDARVGLEKFERGSRHEVIARDSEKVRVRDEQGKERTLPLKRSKSFAVFGEGLIPVAAGERIRITGNGRTLDRDHRVNNGESYRVAGFTPEGNIRLDNGWTISRDFGRIDYGYIATSNASQGPSGRRNMLALSTADLGATSIEQVYVSISRGTESLVIYTDDRRSLIEALSRSSRRQSAVELVSGTNAAERTRQHAAQIQRLRMYEESRTRTSGRTRGREREQSHER